MFKSKNKFLALLISLLFVSLPGIYAEDLQGDEINFDNGVQNINTANSYIQPAITVRTLGYYAWTASGPVFFSHGNSPGAYWDSGGIVPGSYIIYCKIYRSPWIKGGAILLAWAPLTLMGTSNEVYIKKITFGDVSSTSDVIGNKSVDVDFKFNRTHSVLIK